MNQPLIYLIAGEPSGDLLAARLMVALRALGGAELRFCGIGGEAMRAQGLDSLFPQADLAIMGLAEVVPRIPKLLGRLRQTMADIRRMRPDVIVTVDSWGFSGRIHQQLKEEGYPAPRIHYVAPMVWAWKERRVHSLASRLDLLLCLLPNEPAYFQKVKLPAVHVGHAVLESGAEKGNGEAFRLRHHIAPDTPLLCVLPGSRHSETSRLLPVFAQTVEALRAHYPNLQLVVPTVETVAKEVSAAVRAWDAPVTVVFGQQERYDAFAACQTALAASGTVALELAMASLPMVIAYRVAPLTAFLIRFLLKVKNVCLLNLLMGREIVPEFLQEQCRAEILAPAVLELMEKGAARQSQLAGIREALERLGQDKGSPSQRAADFILTSIRKVP
ncbi:MAG TPA: lipid-A-disaccharide synthase [Rhodospirillaceae bacterium]|nr:lipid-A-disaccharide synthase [Rhodospirillaceae bacterium]